MLDIGGGIDTKKGFSLLERKPFFDGVRMRGFEPPRPYRTLDPESSASANSATSACVPREDIRCAELRQDALSVNARQLRFSFLPRIAAAAEGGVPRASADDTISAFSVLVPRSLKHCFG